MANTTEQAIRNVLKDVHIETGRTDEFEAVVARLVSALTAASAEAATPVAWKLPDGELLHAEDGNDFWRIGGTPLYTAAPQASQPIGQPESQIRLKARELAEFVDVTKRLPERGQRIQGLSRSGAWIETFDPDEPIGHMTHWRAVDDDATDSTEQPISESQCKHAYTGNAGDGYTCMFCMQPKDSRTVEIDSQPVSDDLAPHLRQYQHNDGSGFVFGYDTAGVDRLVASLQARLNSQPVSGAGMTDEQLCEFLPENVMWGDSITPELVRTILSASGQAVSEKAVRDAALEEFAEHAKKHYNPITAAFVVQDIHAMQSTPAQQTEAPVNVPELRYIPACEVTSAQREQARKSDLYKHGDMKLVWVNEGDLCELQMRAALAAAPAPVQTEAQQSEKDAKRFRFALIESPMWTYAVCKWDGSDWLPITREQELAELDAAIAQEKANQKGGA